MEKNYVSYTKHQMAHFKKSDGKSVRVTVQENTEVKAGELVYLDGFLGFAMQDVTTGSGETAPLILSIEPAEYETDQINTGQDFNKGTRIYWDDGEGYLTETPTTVYAGVVTSAKDANDVIWFVLKPGVTGDEAMNAIGDMDDLETDPDDDLVIAMNSVNRAMGVPVRNESGEQIDEGELVYLSGWHEGEGRFLISKADADAAGASAQFVLREDIAHEANGWAWRSHTLEDVDTQAGSAGNAVYLSTTAGGWTVTPPDAADAIRQIVGRIVDEDAEGVIEFLLPGQLVKLGRNELQDDAVGEDQIVDDAVATAKIPDGAVTEAKLAAPGTDGLGVLRTARFTFDADAEAALRDTGAHELDVEIPVNAVIMDGIVHVLNAFTSGTSTATIAIHVQDAEDVVAAAAVSGAPWSTKGLKDVVPDGQATNMVFTEEAKKVTVTVAEEALTAGAFIGVLRYVVTDEEEE